VRAFHTLLCAAAALTIAGCQATASDDAPENERPLKVQHALGLTKVPGKAERPVALYPSELDDSLALGTTPVGAAGAPFPHYLGPRIREIARVGTVARPNLTEIEALNPDLILAAKQSQRRLYKRLEEIAPTVALDQKVDWKPNLRQDGEALGESDFAEKLLTQYDAQAARVRSAIRRNGPPKFPDAVRDSLSRPFVASILDDVHVDHPKPKKDLLPGARPGPYDAWTLGMGYVAATKILDDLERFTRP
jgi:ABC-type Fe3+-hydroxamate transport system substrate-binding protein